jgi:hypothetical protein
MRYALRHHDIRFALGAEGLVLGRGAGCDVALDGDDISRRHARIAPSEDGVIVEDLGSRNGVFVNGRRIDGQAPLTVGDVVTVGSHELRVVVDRTDSLPPVSLPPRAGDDQDEEQTQNSGTLGKRFMGGYSMLASGMIHRAERELGKFLQQYTAAAATGYTEPTDALMALRFAMRLALETRRATWLDCALQLIERTPVPLTQQELTPLTKAVTAIGDPHLARSAAAKLRARGFTDSTVLAGLDRLARH